MNFQEYCKLALRTKSDKFFGNQVAGVELMALIGDLLSIERRVTAMKKALYYGKIDDKLKVGDIPEGSEEAYLGDERINPLSILGFYCQLIHPNGVDAFHAILGLISESIELLGGFINTDEVNKLEELGDVFWYLPLYLQAEKLDPEQVWDANIAKLRARFPDKFTTEQALSRNLANETHTLETFIGKWPSVQDPNPRFRTPENLDRLKDLL